MISGMGGEKKADNISFEEAMAELDQLVRASEEGKIPLDDMIANLERGNRLAAFCRARLNELERRIEILSGTREEAQWSDFDAGSSREN